MPVVGDYGYGEYTPLKTEHFSRFIRMHLEVASAVLKKHASWLDQTYHYFDLTAGPGVFDGADQSPMVYLKTVRELQLAHDSYFFERDEWAFNSLAQCLGNGSSVHCVLGDHQQRILPCISNTLRIPKPHYIGLLYYDVTPCIEMFESIKLIADLTCRLQMERIDVLLYLSPAKIKQMKECNGCQRLPSIIQSFRKSHWLIREPFGKHQWTFMLGSNWDGFKEYKKIRFFRLNSPEGEQIFSKVAWTPKEREEQQKESGVLPFAEPADLPPATPYRNYAEYLQHPRFRAIFQLVLDRAKNICERCKIEPASEPHHLRYPPWGTFDVPENLIAVCHKCHCELHGKGN